MSSHRKRSFYKMVNNVDINRLRARSWCFTLNNYTPADELALSEVVCEHMIYGREVGEEGTPHLQGFVRFRHAKTGRTVRGIRPGWHIEVARNLDAAIEYCRKDGDVVERGSTTCVLAQRANAQARGGAANSERWSEAYKAAQEGRYEDIPADIRFKHDTTIQRIRLKRLSEECPDSIEALENEWIWGPTGSGKSTTAREENPGAYFKMRNKWWDGYEYEPVVIIDDLDPTHEQWIQSFLKDWADHHKFRCELKGSSACIRPRRIIVTSQYEISQIFKDPETVAALRRRFTERHMPLIGPINQVREAEHVSGDFF